MTNEITLLHPELIVGSALLIILGLICHLVSKYGSKQGINYGVCLILCIFFTPIFMLLVFAVVAALKDK